MANLTYTVPNKNGSYDGDMVIKQYSSFTINSGDTVTTDQPCRGLFIYVTGNCTINGTLTMTARGAYANPTSSGGSDNNSVDANGLRLGLFTSSGTDSLTSAATLFNGCGNAVRTAISNQPSISGNGTILTVARTNTSVDGFTATQRDSSSNYGTPTRKTSVSNSTGTGGRGGYWMNDNTQSGTNLVFGGYSSCFGGGSGGGGWNGNGFSSVSTGTNATNYGGPGGTGASNHSNAGLGGGAGNPKGGGSGTYGVAQDGTGGVIWLIVGGNLTIGSSGVISANGRNGGNSGGGDFNSAGGGSGGGRIIIAHKGTFTNNGSITVTGGSGGSSSNGYAEAGQPGMNGSSTVLQVI